MRVGISSFAQNFTDWERHTAGDFDRPPKIPDSQIFDDELRLAELAEPLGFDSIWTVEHHFTPYTMVPNPIQYLSYLAGRTRRVDFGTMVVVLPWHDPVQVAEEISLLDNLLQGRKLNIGLGRGAGRVEFEGLRVPMGESRQRFLESLEVIRLALSNEQFSFEGEFHQIPPLSIRPRPRSDDLLERMYCAWGSPGTIEIAAKAELGALFIPQKSWEEIGTEVQQFNGFRAELGLAPQKPIVCCWAYCAESEAAAQEASEEYMGNYGESANLHYELYDPQHFLDVGGYEHYAQAGLVQDNDARVASRIAFSETQVFGTAKTCLEKLRYIKEIADASEFIGVFLYGAMPVEKAEASMRAFADEVLPVVQRDF